MTPAARKRGPPTATRSGRPQPPAGERKPAPRARVRVGCARDSG